MFVRRIHLAVPVFALFAGAAPVMAQSVQVITPAPVPVQSQVVIAPSAPPAPRFEAVPPPPSEQARVMYWRPGHWMWDGANWAWSQGQYVSGPHPRLYGSLDIGFSSLLAATSGSTAAGQVDDGTAASRALGAASTRGPVRLRTQ